MSSRRKYLCQSHQVLFFCSSFHLCISVPTKLISDSNIVMLTSIRRLSASFPADLSMSNLLLLIASRWKTQLMPSRWLLTQLKVQSRFRFRTEIALHIFKHCCLQIKLCYHNKKSRTRICSMITTTVHTIEILRHHTKNAWYIETVAGNV